MSSVYSKTLNASRFLYLYPAATPRGINSVHLNIVAVYAKLFVDGANMNAIDWKMRLLSRNKKSVQKNHRNKGSMAVKYNVLTPAPRNEYLGVW